MVPSQTCFWQLLLACMDACCNNPAAAAAAQCLLEWARQGRLGFQLNQKDCTQLVKALLTGVNLCLVERDLQFANALAVLDMMEAQGLISQADRCFSMLLAVCWQVGDVSLGRCLHRRLIKSKISLDNFTVACLIQAA